MHIIKNRAFKVCVVYYKTVMNSCNKPFESKVLMSVLIDVKTNEILAPKS